MGMRSIQKLNISLGLFGFPVAIYKATDDPTDGIAFRQLHTECGVPVNRPTHCYTCHKDVQPSEITKGYEVAPGTFIKFSDAELKDVRPVGAGSITIKGYIAPDDVDPAYQDGQFYLMKPDGKDSTTFRTWRDALKGRWAVGTVVMYGRERVVAIRALDRLLSMHFIRTHAEIRNVFDVPGYEDVPTNSPAEYAELMEALVERDTIAIDEVVIEKDSYVLAVQEMIEARKAGMALPVAVEAKPAAGKVDVMAMLKAALAQPKKGAVAA